MERSVLFVSVLCAAAGGVLGCGADPGDDGPEPGSREPPSASVLLPAPTPWREPAPPIDGDVVSAPAPEPDGTLADHLTAGPRYEGSGCPSGLCAEVEYRDPTPAP